MTSLRLPMIPAAPNSSSGRRSSRASCPNALKGADPDSNCWTFGLPRSRLFWFRRQALETAVHAWDVQHATANPIPLTPIWPPMY